MGIVEKNGPGMERELVSRALSAMNNSYAPYSRFRVGAVVLTANGNIFTGCNIENSSYGATCCAERTAIFKAVSDGEPEIKAIAIASDSDDYTYPCGICRQVISEFAPPDCILLCSNKDGKYIKLFLKDLLPHAFGKGFLTGE